MNKRIREHCSVEARKHDLRMNVNTDALKIDAGQSPTHPFFGDILHEIVGEGVENDPAQKKLQIKFRNTSGENTERTDWIRAALLYLMLRGRMVKRKWWILAAEAVKCYEQTTGGKTFPVDAKTPMSIIEKKILNDLYHWDIKSEEEFLSRLNVNDPDTAKIL